MRKNKNKLDRSNPWVRVIDTSIKYNLQMLPEGRSRQIEDAVLLDANVCYSDKSTIKVFAEGYQDLYFTDDYFCYLIDVGKVKKVLEN